MAGSARGDVAHSLNCFHGSQRDSGVSVRLARIASALFVCLLLVGASVGAAATSSPLTAPEVADPTGPAQVTAPPVNATNESNQSAAEVSVPVVDHEDPRTALGRGSARAAATYLVGSMSNRLVQSARLLDRREYAEAAAELDEDYTDLYARYDDIRGDVGVSPEAAERFAVVRTEQLQYIEAIREYQITREDYIEARREADSFRSRRLARQMEFQVETVVQHRDNLLANYTLMTEMGDRGNETMRLVDQQAESVIALQSVVRDVEFVDTRFRVTVPNSSGSFSYPYRLVGTVTTVDGVPLANTSGQLLVGGQRFPVRTDANGTFTVLYRPTTIPDGAVTVEMRFFVDEESQYLGDRTTVDLFVAQETPQIAVRTRPSTVGFGQELVVSGTVGAEAPESTALQARIHDQNAFRDRLVATVERAALEAAAANETPPVVKTLEIDVTDFTSVTETDTVSVTVNLTAVTTVTGPVDPFDLQNGTVETNETALDARPLPPVLRTPLPTEFAGAGNVTLSLSLGDLPLGTTTTDTDGRYEFVTTVPADIRPGSQPVGVSLVGPDRALAPADTSTILFVQTTPTQVQLDEVTTRGRDAVVAGVFTTESGTPLPGRQIEIRFDGDVVETVRTGENGEFGTVVPLPTRDSDRTAVRVVAGFDTPTTNLAPTRSAASIVVLPEPRGEVTEEVPIIARLRSAFGLGEAAFVLPGVNVGIEPELIAGVVGVTVLVVAVLLAVRRRRTGPVTTAGRRRIGDVSAETFLARGQPDPTDVTDRTPPAAYLRAAHDALSSSNSRLATEYAYVAVRRNLAADTTLPNRATHREFRQTLRERNYRFADRVDTLTDLYERAAFSPRGVSTDEAQRAISVAEQLVS